MCCPWTAKTLLSEIYNIPLIIWTWKAVLEETGYLKIKASPSCLTEKWKKYSEDICFSVHLVVESARIRNNLNSEALDYQTIEIVMQERRGGDIFVSSATATADDPAQE